MTPFNHDEKNDSACGKVLPRLKAWLDAELSDAQAAHIASHLAQCEPCCRVADDFRSISAAVRTALEVSPTPTAAKLAYRAASSARVVVLQERELVASLKRVAVAAALLFVMGLALVLAIPDHSRGELDQVLELALNDDVWAEDF